MVDHGTPTSLGEPHTLRHTQVSRCDPGEDVALQLKPPFLDGVSPDHCHVFVRVSSRGEKSGFKFLPLGFEIR